MEPIKITIFYEEAREPYSDIVEIPTNTNSYSIKVIHDKAGAMRKEHSGYIGQIKRKLYYISIFKSKWYSFNMEFIRPDQVTISMMYRETENVVI